MYVRNINPEIAKRAINSACKKPRILNIYGEEIPAPNEWIYIVREYDTIIFYRKNGNRIGIMSDRQLCINDGDIHSIYLTEYYREAVLYINFEFDNRLSVIIDKIYGEKYKYGTFHFKSDSLIVTSTMGETYKRNDIIKVYCKKCASKNKTIDEMFALIELNIAYSFKYKRKTTTIRVNPVWGKDYQKFEDFNFMITGIDKKSLEITDDKTSFTVIFGMVTAPYKTQKEFLMDRKDDLIPFIINSIKESKGIMRTIKNLEIYRMTDIVLKRDSSFAVVFSLKDGLLKFSEEE